MDPPRCSQLALLLGLLYVLLLAHAADYPAHAADYPAHRAAARLQLQDFPGALQDAQAALSIEPSYAKALYRSGVALQHLGRLEEAGHQLDLALSADPHNREVAKQVQAVHHARAQRALLQASLGVGGTPTAPSHPPSGASSGGGPEHHLHVDDDGGAGSAGPKWSSELIPTSLRPGHVFQDSADGDGYNLLILLHGLGDSAKPFSGLARKMQLPQTATLALSGPQEVLEADGGRSWFTVFEEDGEFIQAYKDRRRPDSLNVTVVQLAKLISNLEVAGWPYHRVHLFGFSQGGTTALSLNQAFTGLARLGGCITVASQLMQELLREQEAELARGGAGGTSGTSAATPSLPHSAATPSLPSTGAIKPGPGTPVPSAMQKSPPAPPPSAAAPVGGAGAGPVLMTVGDRDEMVPVASVERTATVLRAQGTPAEVYVAPGKGHAMVGSEAEMRRLMTFWARTLSRRPRGAGFQEVRRGGP